MESKKSFGEYLRSKRTEAGFTQKSFAGKLFVTESAVSKWERGLSYPDITLIGDMCELLHISEHELLTASEDTEARSHEKLAKRYLTLIKKIKTAQYFIYGVPLLVCFICNIAVGHNLSWFFIVLAAEMVAASLTLTPVLAEKQRGLSTLACFVASLIILLLVCCIYTGGDWFFVASVSVFFGMSVLLTPLVLRSIWLPEPVSNHKALAYYCVNTVLLFLLLLVCDLYTRDGMFLKAMCPIAAYCLILPWGMMLIIRYTKINRFFKTACCLGLLGVFYYFLYGVVDMLLGYGPYRFGFNFNIGNWSQINPDGRIIIIGSFSLAGLALIFMVAGIVYDLLRVRKKDDAA